MRLPSCLVDPKIPLVADTSVAINLKATGCMADILRALPNPVIVTDVVLGELSNGHRHASHDMELITGLVKEGLIEIVQLTDTSETIFAQLVSGSTAQTLDDGESATIAYASEIAGIPLIDERKAIRIFSERFPAMLSACTVDIFSHTEVQNTFEQEDLSNAVFNALMQARMRVLPHHIDWVVNLIGQDRARFCNSLSKSVRLSSSINGVSIV